MTRPPTIEEVAYHEAGHAVGFVHFAMDFIRVTVVPGRLANFSFEGFRKVETVIAALGHVKPRRYDRYMFRRDTDHAHRIIVSLMGPMAEMKFAPDGPWLEGCGGDLDVVEKLSEWLGLSDDDVTSRDAARALTNRLWPHIEAVAAALVEHKTLTARQVRKIMGVKQSQPQNVRVASVIRQKYQDFIHDRDVATRELLSLGFTVTDADTYLGAPHFWKAA